MKFVLKIAIWPVVLLLNILCLLGNLTYTLGAYIVSLPLLFLIGCCIYCIVAAMWTSLAILAGVIVLGLAALFSVVYLTVWLEELRDRLNRIIWS